MSFTSSPLTWEPLQLAVVNRFIFTGYWSTVPVPDRYHPVLNRKDRNQRNNKDLTKSNGWFGQTRTNFRNRNKVRGKKMKVCNNLFSIFFVTSQTNAGVWGGGGAWKFIFVFFLQTNGSVTVWEGRGWASREGGQGASSCLGPSVDPPPHRRPPEGTSYSAQSGTQPSKEVKVRSHLGERAGTRRGGGDRIQRGGANRGRRQDEG